MARQLNQMQDWARETRLTQARVVVLAALMLVVMVGLLYRYFYLQIVQNETFRRSPMKPHCRSSGCSHTWRHCRS